MLIAQDDYKNERYGDSHFNMKFYHLSPTISIDTSLLSGNALLRFEATKEDVESITLDLHQAYKISKIDGAASFEHTNNKVVVQLDKKLAKDESHEITVFYKGAPPIIKENDISKGLVRGTHGKKDNPIIATVCFPNKGYLWFPCKTGSLDKADSLYVDVTIEDRKVEEVFLDPRKGEEVAADLPLIAVSNGNMEGVTTKDGMKTFKWRHRHRIAPHHVLIAISDFMKVEKEFKGRGYGYPIDFYIFPEKFKKSRAMFNRAHEIMACLTKTFGAYPYRDERFAVTMTGFPLGMDGIPTQTNVLLEDMRGVHMYRLVHQAASMWFGNHISPDGPENAWITEALAAYAEAFWQEYKRGLTVYQIILDEKEYFKGGKLYQKEADSYAKERFNKKGLYAMHMLRGIMGDIYFFQTLQSITERREIRGRYARSYLSTERFQKICEYYASENIDQDYTYFFDQWVYGEFYPEFKVKYGYDKRELYVDVEQNIRETTPNFFKMPVKIQLITEEDRVIKKTINVQKAKQRFTFDNKDIKKVLFDPSNWVFKDLKYTAKVDNDKKALENFEITTTNHRRKVEVSFDIPKKQDIIIRLMRVADGVSLLEDKEVSLKEFDKQEGSFKKSFKVPLSYSQRGVFRLEIEGKGETYYKVLRLKRIKELF